MFLHEPPASAEAEQLFLSDRDDVGFVMNLSRLWAWRPDVCTGFSALRDQLAIRSALSPRERAVLVCATAAELGDAYCALAWGSRLAAQLPDAHDAGALLRGEPVSALSQRETALASWARAVTRDPNGTTAGDVQRLRDAGLDDREIFEATTFIAFRQAFSTINDALSAAPDRQLQAQAPPPVRDAVVFGRAPADGAG
ncbi:hypothetical protein O4H66_02235 [Comamonadaceae bacterium G21597-S1]|nr:hypothetical protein [Comamonadaceae bacterium G21597-S1]